MLFVHGLSSFLQRFPRLLLCGLFLLTTACTIDSNIGERPADWATPIDQELNLYQVDQGFFRSQQPFQDDVALIRSLGVKTIVNLRAFHSDEDVLDAPDIELIQIPINTWNIQDHHIIAALNAIEEAKKKEPVLLHCQHGADRTGLVSAMYRVLYQGWSKERALDELKNGGYGYHAMWKNIPRYLEEVDVERILLQLNVQPFSSQ